MGETIVLAGDTAYTSGCRQVARAELGRIHDSIVRALVLLNDSQDVTALFELLDAEERIASAISVVRSL